MWYPFPSRGFVKSDAKKLAAIIESQYSSEDVYCQECWVRSGHDIMEWPPQKELRKSFSLERAVKKAKVIQDPGNPFMYVNIGNN